MFGIIGDGTAYSEGAAYGSDQSGTGRPYSSYSVYQAQSKDTYNSEQADFIANKKAVIKETRVRLLKLPAYIEKTQWFEVKNELTRYMYETRQAVRGLAKTTDQKEAADAFFKAIENVYTQNTAKNGEKTLAAQKDAVVKLDAFAATL